MTNETANRKKIEVTIPRTIIQEVVWLPVTMYAKWHQISVVKLKKIFKEYGIKCESFDGIGKALWVKETEVKDLFINGMNYSVTTTVTTEAYFEIVDQELYDNEQEKRAKREENKKEVNEDQKEEIKKVTAEMGRLGLKTEMDEILKKKW